MVTVEYRPGHDEKRAISAADNANLAPMGLDPVISQHEILSLNHGNRSCREMLGSSPSMTNSGQAGVSVVPPVCVKHSRESP
jgi:hypothetical protein